MRVGPGTGEGEERKERVKTQQLQKYKFKDSWRSCLETKNSADFQGAHCG